LKQNYRKM